MAELEQGVLGAVKGTVGTITGSRWKGKNYIRIKSGKRTGKPSAKQQVQRAKFSLVGTFIRAMRNVFRVTFSNYATGITEHNYAFGYAIGKAVTGIYPDFVLDYRKVLVAQGSLTNAENVSSVNDGPGKITYHWTDNSGMGTAKPQDKAILVAYCEELNQCNYKSPAAERQATQDSLAVSAFSGKKVQTWLSFLSEEGEVATSIYTGELIIA